MVKATRDAALCQLWTDLHTPCWWCMISLDAIEHNIAQLSSQQLDLTNNVEESHSPYQLMVHQYR